MDRPSKLYGPRMPRSDAKRKSSTGDDSAANPQSRRPDELYRPRPTGDNSAANPQSRRPGKLRGPRMPRVDANRRLNTDVPHNANDTQSQREVRSSSPDSNIAKWLANEWTPEKRAQRRFEKSSADSSQAEMWQSSAEGDNRRAQTMPESRESKPPLAELGHEGQENFLALNESLEAKSSSLDRAIREVHTEKSNLEKERAQLTDQLTDQQKELDAQDYRLAVREVRYTQFAEALDRIHLGENWAMHEAKIHNNGLLGRELNPQQRMLVEAQLASQIQRVKDLGQEKRAELTESWSQWKEKESHGTYKLGQRKLSEALDDEYKDNERGREELAKQQQTLGEIFDYYRQKEIELDSRLDILETAQLTARIQLG